MNYSDAILIAALSTFAPSLQADVNLPALFSDHAVLLSGAAVPVWGWADPGEKVEVSVAGQTKSAMADASGKWRVKLDALKADSEPQELIVKGNNTLTVKDVLVGEVWLGSGQSNMAMMVSGSNDFGKEKDAANLPQVRMFTVTSEASAKAEQDCIGSWALCSPKTVGEFSATLYFFGREIHENLGVPTGLINSSVGGTPIEAWTPADVQPQSPAAKKKVIAPPCKTSRERDDWRAVQWQDRAAPPLLHSRRDLVSGRSERKKRSGETTLPSTTHATDYRLAQALGQ